MLQKQKRKEFGLVVDTNSKKAPGDYEMSPFIDRK